MPSASIFELAPPFLAYLDPGLGSMQLQILIAGLLSGMFFVRTFFARARDVLGRLFKRPA